MDRKHRAVLLARNRICRFPSSLDC